MAEHASVDAPHAPNHNQIYAGDSAMTATDTSIVGQKFNHLTILRRLPKAEEAKHRLGKVLAQCDCGSIKEYFLTNIKIGNSRSCGCPQFRPTKKHPEAGGREYKVWSNMKQRCLNENNAYYPMYGGRGITVCDRWKKFENFYSDMGECPEGLTLERKENDEGYGPENCIWADRKTQAGNRRSSLVNRNKIDGVL